MSDFLSIYVHWPFCKSKCPYCDFNSHVRNAVDLNQFIDAYLIELDSYQHVLNGKIIKSIFFGGGTPSLAPPVFFEKVINKISKYSTLAPQIEVTLEANPTSSEAKKFYDYSRAGVNRVSIGIQSFNQKYLKFLGREHSADEAREAIFYAAKYFSRYSFDLIYALPEQSLKSWEEELSVAIKYTNKHMSVYQLTIEKGTQFYGDYKKKKFTMPNQNIAADFYYITQNILSKYGMPQYEISNHAAAGEESIHNMTYWEYGDYLGIGAGAHGRYTFNSIKYATVNTHLPEKWLKQIEERGNALQHKEELSEDEQNEEKIIMGLRLSKGVDKKLLFNKRKYKQLLEDGYLDEGENLVRATEKGRLVLNRLISELIV
ncbi:radical SAM family heme chaperone HemW [Candidatus Jidaibacter acanthamoebae]|uniref:radical SAM family heme chaperone HemW n=1 Tax=Candidatus Jidaibacter acanthamoebae TaxID=86105 RepID=UPI0013792DA7|nr:radical SAM family heme chaperone HemW [Candidatus Jidaibacter acanthamoeba]